MGLCIAEEEREKEDLLQQSATSAALLAAPAPSSVASPRFVSKGRSSNYKTKCMHSQRRPIRSIASPTHRPVVESEGDDQDIPPAVAFSTRPATDRHLRRPAPFGGVGAHLRPPTTPLERQLRETCKDLIALLCINNDLSYEVMARALPSGVLCMRCAPCREDDRRRMLSGLLRPDFDLMMEQHLASLPQAAPGAATAPASPAKGGAGAALQGAKVRDLWFGPPVAAPTTASSHGGGGGISGLLLSPARSARGARRESGAALRPSLPPGQNWRAVLAAVTQVGGLILICRSFVWIVLRGSLFVYDTTSRPKQDWKTPELVWSAETRQELASGLGAEVDKLDFLREERVRYRVRSRWDGV